MYNHYRRHDEGENVYKVGGTLKDDCVCEVNGARIAVSLHASVARDFRRRADMVT
jgi:hypothetical protein